MSIKNRLKGRNLQAGNTIIVSLSVLISIVLIFIVNLMPLIYEKLFYLKFEKSNIIKFVFSLLVVLIAALIYSCTKFGVCRFFFKRAKNIRAGAEDIFYYFRLTRAFSVLVFSFRCFLIKMCCFICCFIPAIFNILLIFVLSSTSLSLGVALVLLCGVILFSVSGIYFYNILASSLFLADYYYISGEYINFRHLIACSQSVMENKKSELFKLRLSFSGWFLLCILLLPVFYVFCYYKQTMAVLAVEYM